MPDEIKDQTLFLVGDVKIDLPMMNGKRSEIVSNNEENDKSMSNLFQGRRTIVRADDNKKSTVNSSSFIHIINSKTNKLPKNSLNSNKMF